MGAEGDLLARLAAARAFEKEAGGWRFTLQLPTAYEARRLALAVRAAGDAGAQEWMRALVLASVRGWDGPTVGDLLGDGDAAPLPYSPELAAALLEDRVELMDEIAAAIHDERTRREAARESARKNS